MVIVVQRNDLLRLGREPLDEKRFAQPEPCMHTLKVILLVTLTLTVMRVLSWALTWPLVRWWPGRVGAASAAGNSLALLLFLSFLHWDRMPGEVLDFAAAMFGVAVYTIFGLVDWVWLPGRGKRGRPKAAQSA
jgi:hypothetical protein